MGTPHPGPEGCRGPGAQDALQAGVADPTGPRLLPQVLCLVECVLPPLTASVQGLNQADGGARPEEAPEGRREQVAQNQCTPPSPWGGMEGLEGMRLALQWDMLGTVPHAQWAPHRSRNLSLLRGAQTPRCRKGSPSVALSSQPPFISPEDEGCPSRICCTHLRPSQVLRLAADCGWPSTWPW